MRAPSPEILDEAAVGRSLDALRRVVSADDDPALAAIFDATERVATQWLAQRDRADRCLAAYREAARAGERTSEQLDSMLRMLAALAVRSDARETKRGRTKGVSGWFRQRAHTRRVIAVSAAAAVGAPTRDAPSAIAAPESDRSPPPTSPGLDSSADAAVLLLGEFRLTLRGRPLNAWQGTKSQRLIRFLLAHHTRQVPKDVLIEVFWPMVGAATGRRNLHQAVYMIRRVIRAHTPDMELIIHDNDAYAVNEALEIFYDTTLFEDSALTGRNAERTGDLARARDSYAVAEQCYRGDFLEDSPYEDWALTERDRLRLLYLDTANHLGDLLVAGGDLDAAFQIDQRLLRRDPCDERAHRRAMRCFAAAGQRSLVAQQYRACADALGREMALEPSAETTDLYASLIGD
jgi:DNA-binding SARP family transcriptional activator